MKSRRTSINALKDSRSGGDATEPAVKPQAIRVLGATAPLPPFQKRLTFAVCAILFIALAQTDAHAETAPHDKAQAIKTIIAEGMQDCNPRAGKTESECRESLQAIAEVIHRRGSLKYFSASKRKDLNKFVKSNADYLQAIGVDIRAIAKEAYTAGRTSNITNGADHYENIEAFGVPWWASGKIVVAKVGSHTYYL